MTMKYAVLAGTAALLAGNAVPAPADAAPIPPAASYADLFKPVDNAAERLAADDAARVNEAQVVKVDYHHHHHRFRYHHHHHHHWHSRAWYLSNGYIWDDGVWVLRRFRPHHHHHHHHRYRW